MSVAWPVGVQLIVVLYICISVLFLDNQGVPRCRKDVAPFESSFLIHHGFIRDCLVSRDDSLMVRKSSRGLQILLNNWNHCSR